jgi:hypothetical protein
MRWHVFADDARTLSYLPFLTPRPASSGVTYWLEIDLRVSARGALPLLVVYRAYAQEKNFADPVA